jgi:hypothetical protein
LFPYPVWQVSIPVLNMYLRQTYSNDGCDEDESLKTIMNCMRRCIKRCIKKYIRLILKRLCWRDYAEEIMLKRRGV